jgi:arylsulfatase A-like enzyme
LILITADHGGSGKNHGQDIPEHREIPWIASGVGVKPHFTLSAKISTMDTAATILWALGLPVPASWQGKAVQEAFK